MFLTIIPAGRVKNKNYEPMAEAENRVLYRFVFFYESGVARRGELYRTQMTAFFEVFVTCV